jgi:hypothetical protein
MAQHLTPTNTIDERNAAPYLGYTPAALRAWRHQGRGPAYIRHNRSVRYRVADLDAWLEKHCVRTRENSR